MHYVPCFKWTKILFLIGRNTHPVPESYYLFWTFKSSQGIAGSTSDMKAKVFMSNSSSLPDTSRYLVFISQTDKSVLIQGRKHVFAIQTGAEFNNLLGFVIIDLLSWHTQTQLSVILQSRKYTNPELFLFPVWVGFVSFFFIVSLESLPVTKNVKALFGPSRNWLPVFHWRF